MRRLKQIKIQVVLAIFIGFLTSCATSNNIQTQDTQTAYQEILKMFEEYHAAVKIEGLIKQIDYLDASSDFFWLPVGYKNPQDYNALKTIIKESAENLKSVELEWISLKIVPVTNHSANFSGVVKVSLEDVSGTPSAAYVIETGTLIKRNGQWKLLSGQSQISKPSYK